MLRNESSESQQIPGSKFKKLPTLIELGQSNIDFYPNDRMFRPKGCLYIFHEKRFIDQSLNIYKIGQTSRNARDRLKQYEEGTEIIYEHYLNINQSEIMSIETKIKRIFRNKFKKGPQSTERFEGDIKEIKKEFIKIIEECTEGENISFDIQFKNDINEAYGILEMMPKEVYKNMDYKEAKFQILLDKMKFFNEYYQNNYN